MRTALIKAALSSKPMQTPHAPWLWVGPDKIRKLLVPVCFAIARSGGRAPVGKGGPEHAVKRAANAANDPNRPSSITRACREQQVRADGESSACRRHQATCPGSTLRHRARLMQCVKERPVRRCFDLPYSDQQRRRTSSYAQWKCDCEYAKPSDAPRIR